MDEYAYVRKKGYKIYQDKTIFTKIIIDKKSKLILINTQLDQINSLLHFIVMYIQGTNWLQEGKILLIIKDGTGFRTKTEKISRSGLFTSCCG